jgi:pilus assembly protein CpaE
MKSDGRTPVKSGRIINVIGSKGGVGTTMIATNLAVNLARTGKDRLVALVDMNMLFGEVSLFLNIQPKYHWGVIADSIDRIDRTFLFNTLSRHNSGLYVLPAPGKFNGHAEATPATMKRLLALMREIFDYTVIDSGQSLKEISLAASGAADGVLLVSTLSLPCLVNSRKMLESFEEVNIDPKAHVKILINRFLKKSEISLKDAEKTLGKKAFWLVPNDYKRTVSSINQGRPLAETAPKAPTAKSLDELARYYAEGQGEGKRKRWKFLVN